MTKRVLDVVGALIGLVLLAPLAAVSGVVIALSSRGGVLHRARRVGLGGRTFTMFKLRTMRAEEGPRITAGGDERVTGVGRGPGPSV